MLQQVKIPKENPYVFHYGWQIHMLHKFELGKSL